MDKLLKLLNKYSSLNWLYYLKGMFVHDVEKDVPHVHYTVIISKEYGFIKWLVDNKKINLKKFHKLCGIINQDSKYWNSTPQDYEQVIMYLSISDCPIEDLVSILK